VRIYDKKLCPQLFVTVIVIVSCWAGCVLCRTGTCFWRGSQSLSCAYYSTMSVWTQCFKPVTFHCDHGATGKSSGDLGRLERPSQSLLMK